MELSFTIHAYSYLHDYMIGLCRGLLGQMAEAMPQAINVTPEEREAIARVTIINILNIESKAFCPLFIY